MSKIYDETSAVTIETADADDLETVKRRYAEAQARSEAAKQVMGRAKEAFHQAIGEEDVLRLKLIALSLDHERRRALKMSRKRARFTATVAWIELDAVGVKGVREAATGALVLPELHLPLKPMGLALDTLKPGATIAFDARPYGDEEDFGLEHATKGEASCR